jgi:hypothetical protein
VVAVLLALPASAAAQNFTWTGVTTSPAWSEGGNWAGSVAPAGSVGTLNFPELTSQKFCLPPPVHEPGSPTCYITENDIDGLSANAIVMQGGGYELVGTKTLVYVYHVSGKPLTLGEGGLTVFPNSKSTAWTASYLELPLTLSSPQNWSVSGNSFAGILFVYGDVSGPSQALEVDLNNGTIQLGSDLDAGPISVTGSGSIYLGEPRGPHYAGTLNGGDGNPVTIGEGVGLFDENTNAFVEGVDSVGDLTLDEHASLQVGQPIFAGGVTLSVNGGVHLSPTDKVSLLYNSHIHAKGPVDLGGAQLFVQDGFSLIDGTPTCNVLERDTLISTTGPLTGAFAGIPDGAVVPLDCEGMPVPPEARFDYSEHSVVAKLVQRTSTALTVSNALTGVDQPLSYTAVVTPERHGEGVPTGTVEFLDHGQPIDGCSAQPLTAGEATSAASCAVSYPLGGSHDISATYLGNDDFAGSSSDGQGVTVNKPAIAHKKRLRIPKRCRKMHGKARARCVRRAHHHKKAHQSRASHR